MITAIHAAFSPQRILSVALSLSLLLSAGQLSAADCPCEMTGEEQSVNAVVLPTTPPASTDLAWGNETLKLTHWCRDHAGSKGKKVHYDSDHQRMRFETKIDGISDETEHTEEVTKVVIELGYQGKVNRTWTWKKNMEKEIKRSSQTYTVLFDESYVTKQMLGYYSATATATVVGTPKDKKKKPATRTITGVTEFCVIAFDTAMAYTRATNDDLVQIKADGLTDKDGKDCNHYFYEGLHVWLKGPGCPFPVSADLHSNRRAPFVVGTGSLTTAPTTTRDLTVAIPGDGDPGPTGSTSPAPSASTTVIVTGNRECSAIGDAEYKVKLVDDPCRNDPATTQKGTVFWFDSKLELVAGAKYQIRKILGFNQGIFKPILGNAIEYRSSARAKPDGIDGTAKQLVELIVGISQNTRSHNETKIRYDIVTPTAAWSSTTSTQRGKALDSMSYSFVRPTPLNDSAITVDPFYDRPGRPDTLDPNSTKPLLNCAGGGIATSHDTPSRSFFLALSATAPDSAPIGYFQIYNSTGLSLGNVQYNFARIDFRINFTTWSVVYNTRTNTLIPLREARWEVDADEKASRIGSDTPSASSDSSASHCPITGQPYSNDTGSESWTESSGKTTLKLIVP